MSQTALLMRVAKLLEDAGIRYMVTGSFASSSQGAPRLTHDIDLVVELTADALPLLVEAFPEPEFYLDPLSVVEAIERRDMFNLISNETGDKIDFWMIKDAPFDQSRLGRRIPRRWNGDYLYVTQPEDTILQKLKWFREEGGTERHLEDALRVYEVQHRILDHDYLFRWASSLNVDDLLNQIREIAEPR